MGRYAMAFGSLRACRNPSSALMRRLLYAERARQYNPQAALPGVPPMNWGSHPVGNSGYHVPMPAGTAGPPPANLNGSGIQTSSGASEEDRQNALAFPVGANVKSDSQKTMKGKVVGHAGGLVRVEMNFL